MGKYDTDEPLTMFGRPWRAGSLWTPILYWIMVANCGLVLDYCNLNPITPGQAVRTLGLAVACTVIGGVAGFVAGKMFGLSRTELPGFAFGAALAFIFAIRQAGMPGVVFTFACVAGIALLALLGFIIGRIPAEDHHPRTGHYTGLTGLATGVWLAYATTVGVINLPGILTWLLLLLLGAGLWPSMRRLQLNHEQEVRDRHRIPQQPIAAIAAVPEPPPLTRAQKFEQIFAACGVNVTVHGNGEEPTNAGYVLHVSFPDFNTTYTTLRGAKEKLEQAFGKVHRRTGGLHPGAIRFARAKNRHGQAIVGEAYVYVDVRDILADNIPLPGEHQRISVLDALTVGQFIDGSPIRLTLAGVHRLIGGQTRKGKSNFYGVLLNLLTRCYDAVVWFDDGKNGSTIRPLLKHWYTGVIDPATGEPIEPPVDYAGIHRIDSEIMLKWAATLCEARPLIRARPEYADADDGDKWRISEEYPAVFFMCDETRVRFGTSSGPSMSNPVDGASPAEMNDLLTTVATQGAGEGVFLILATQRGTITMTGNGDSKSQVSERWCFPVENRSEASEFFGSKTDASELATELVHAGSCVVTGLPGRDEAQKGKVYSMGATKADRLAEYDKIAMLHPQLGGILDNPSAAAIEHIGYAGRGYSGRWHREHFTWVAGEPRPKHLLRWNTTPDMADRVLNGEAAAPGTPAPSNVVQFGGRGTGSTADRMGLGHVPSPMDPTTARPPGAEASAAADDPEWAAYEAAYLADLAVVGRRILAGEDVDSTVVQLPPNEATGIDTMLELITAAGVHGISISGIWNALPDDVRPQDKKTLYVWRDKLIARRAAVQPAGGRGALLYTPQAWSSTQPQGRAA